VSATDTEEETFEVRYASSWLVPEREGIVEHDAVR
jgi:hypothetical protein